MQIGKKEYRVNGTNNAAKLVIHGKYTKFTWHELSSVFSYVADVAYAS